MTEAEAKKEVMAMIDEIAILESDFIVTIKKQDGRYEVVFSCLDSFALTYEWRGESWLALRNLMATEPEGVLYDD